MPCHRLQVLMSPPGAEPPLQCPFFTAFINIAFYIIAFAILFIIYFLLNSCFGQNRSQASAGHAAVPITRLREHQAGPDSPQADVIASQQPHQSLSSNDPVSQTSTTLSDLKNFLQPFAFGSMAGIARDCAVCLSDFETNDLVRRLPVCYHVFHATCIDAWLTSKDTCPLCRSIVKPSEMRNIVRISVT